MKRKSCILAAVLVASTVTAVMAQERMVTPYASVRYFLGAYYQNKDMIKAGLSDAEINGGVKARQDIDLVNTIIPGTSRFGSRFASGNLSGQFELGLYGGHNGRVGVRQAWGAYKFDFGLSVLVGNTDAPWYKPIGAEAWDIYGGPGTSQGDRAPRIRLSFMGAYIDLQSAPISGSQQDSTGYWGAWYNKRDQIVPLTTIGYEFKSDMVDIGVGLSGYKYFLRRGAEGKGATGATSTEVPVLDNTGVPTGDVVMVPGSNVGGGVAPVGPDVVGGVGALDHSLAAYMAFLNGHIKLGGPYVKFNLAYEKAPLLLGLDSTGAHFKGGLTHSIATDMGNWSDAFFEGALELGYKTPDFGVGLFVGYMRNVSSNAKNSDGKSPEGADRIAYGLNIEIPVAKGFRVVPTLYYLDERKDSDKEKQGADALAGIKLQLDL